MDSTHGFAAGITAMLADIMMYLSHWPWQPLTADTATSAAGLLVALGVGIVKYYRHKTNGNGNGNGKAKVPTTPSPLTVNHT